MVQLVSYLAAQQPHEIVGTPESEWVDSYGVPPEGPYDLSTDKGKFELAKDITAFSNAGGGLLVCGLKAKKKQTELYEVAEKVTPFDKKVVDSTKYKDVITEYVRPLLKVKSFWYDHPKNDSEVSGTTSWLRYRRRPRPTSGRWSPVESPTTAGSSTTAGRTRSATATPRLSSRRTMCTGSGTTACGRDAARAPAPQPAANSNWNHSWNALGDPERDAHEPLRHIYALFGLDVTATADRVCHRRADGTAHWCCSCRPRWWER